MCTTVLYVSGAQIFSSGQRADPPFAVADDIRSALPGCSLEDNLGPQMITLWSSASYCVKDPGSPAWSGKQWELKVARHRAFSALFMSCAEVEGVRCVVTIVCERKVQIQQGTAKSSVEPVRRSLGTV